MRYDTGVVRACLLLLKTWLLWRSLLVTVGSVKGYVHVMLTKVSIHALRGAGRSIGVDSGRPSTRGRASPAMTMWAASACVADANNQRHKCQFN